MGSRSYANNRTKSDGIFKSVKNQQSGQEEEETPTNDPKVNDTMRVDPGKGPDANCLLDQNDGKEGVNTNSSQFPSIDHHFDRIARLVPCLPLPSAYDTGIDSMNSHLLWMKNALPLDGIICTIPIGSFQNSIFLYLEA